jgi:hypothetical protein
LITLLSLAAVAVAVVITMVFMAIRGRLLGLAVAEAVADLEQQPHLL